MLNILLLLFSVRTLAEEANVLHMPDLCTTLFRLFVLIKIIYYNEMVFSFLSSKLQILIYLSYRLTNFQSVEATKKVRQFTFPTVKAVTRYDFPVFPEQLCIADDTLSLPAVAQSPEPAVI